MTHRAECRDCGGSFIVGDDRVARHDGPCDDSPETADTTPVDLEGLTVTHAEAYRWLLDVPDDVIDLTLTDPPYSSGGAFRGDRTGTQTRAKYGSSDSILADRVQSFTGDNRDQRSYIAWCTLWMGQVLRATVPGGSIACFTDWRQLPATTDAIQSAGWVWRGIAVWSKPQGQTRPRQNAPWGSTEFVVIGSKGPARTDHVACIDGVITGHVPRGERVHLTQKPVDVLAELARLCPPRGLICDPFSGSGSTAVTARNLGLRFIGAEMDPAIHATAIDRLANEPQPLTLFTDEGTP
jgi:site-specific DNA-methyltransferase (adenine-specific)